MKIQKKMNLTRLGERGCLSSYCILLIFHWYSAIADDTTVTFGTAIFQLFSAGKWSG